MRCHELQSSYTQAAPWQQMHGYMSHALRSEQYHLHISRQHSPSPADAAGRDDATVNSMRHEQQGHPNGFEYQDMTAQQGSQIIWRRVQGRCTLLHFDPESNLHELVITNAETSPSQDSLVLYNLSQAKLVYATQINFRCPVCKYIRQGI